MTLPSKIEIEGRMRAALRSFVVEEGEEWANFILQPEDRLTEEEKHEFLLQCMGHAIGLGGLIVRVMADEFEMERTTLVDMLFNAISLISGGGDDE